MHTDALECTRMRMEKNYTTFGKKLHSIQMARPPNETILEARFGILPGKQAGSKTDRSDLSRKAIDLASLLLASPSAAADYRRAKSSQQTSITWHTNQTNHAHTRCM